MESIKEFFSSMLSQIKNVSVVDALDVVIVSILIYYLYKFIKDRRAGKLATGILLFFALLIISSLTGMQTLYFLLRNFVQVGLIAIFIVFQPELRSMLEQLGEQPIKSLSKLTQATKAELEHSIDMVCDAATEFSLKHVGALIVFERETKLGDVVKTGTVIDAECSLFLIRNVFFDKAPLHDGAVIIRDGRLYAAGCFLPLSSQEIDLNLGTRHRAGLGISENSDALVVIVSEETGNISVALGGELFQCNSISKLKEIMVSTLLPSAEDQGRKKKRGRLFSKKNAKAGDGEGER